MRFEPGFFENEGNQTFTDFRKGGDFFKPGGISLHPTVAECFREHDLAKGCSQFAHADWPEEYRDYNNRQLDAFFNEGAEEAHFWIQLRMEPRPQVSANFKTAMEDLEKAYPLRNVLEEATNIQLHGWYFRQYREVTSVMLLISEFSANNIEAEGYNLRYFIIEPMVQAIETGAATKDTGPFGMEVLEDGKAAVISNHPNFLGGLTPEAAKYLEDLLRRKRQANGETPETPDAED